MLSKQILAIILFWYSAAVHGGTLHTHNPYGHIAIVKPLTTITQEDQKNIETLQMTLTDLRTKKNRLSALEKARIIISYIQIIPADLFSVIDKGTGQALIHHFAPWHWNNDIMATLVDKGVDMSIQTKHPDRFPGSTIAHSVAFISRNKHSELENNQFFKNPALNNHIENCQRFLAAYFRWYPHAVSLQSCSNITCWDALGCIYI